MCKFTSFVNIHVYLFVLVFGACSTSKIVKSLCILTFIVMDTQCWSNAFVFFNYFYFSLNVVYRKFQGRHRKHFKNNFKVFIIQK